MIDPEIVAIFLEEAYDILSNWERECLELEKNIDNPDFDGLFRCAHNIKGSAKSVGLDDLGDFVHQVEEVITLLKSGELKLVPQLVEFLLDSQALLQEWVEELNSDVNFKPEISQLLVKIDQIKEFSNNDAGPDQWKDFGTLAVETGEASEEDVEKAVEIQGRKIGEVMVEEGMIKPETAQKILKTQEKQKEKMGPPKQDESIRVSAKKIDLLIQLIGELSIHNSIVAHAKKNNTLDSYICHNAINRAGKINAEIQSHSLSLRMLPIEGLFQRLERIVRDLARNQGKLIDVVVEGKDVELDKTILETVTEPLIHIVRNAIDHGIEMPEVRGDVGKDERATIKILAKQDATGVIITIVDDGKGLDKERILEKAINKGLVAEADELEDNEIHNLIFEAGFSTAEKVTDVSGRGVGMDVVRQAVTGVGGSVSINSMEGKGSTFVVNLPTSLSIIDGLIVNVDSNSYIIPLLDLAEIIDLNSYKVEKSSNGDEMINLRGKIVPVEELRSYFPLAKKQISVTKEVSEEPKDGMGRPALILEVGRNKVAYEVDEIVGQHTIVVRPLNDQLTTLAGYNGGSIMANGEAGMIIALKKIAKTYIDQRNSMGM